MNERGRRVLIIGAGPAGLAAAAELVKHGVKPLVVDKNDRPGGLARTIWRNGFGFDLGPHRFYTKNEEIFDLWKHYLGDDLLTITRLTRIFYRGRFFAYPLKPVDALVNLGPVATTRALVSYGAQRIKNDTDEPKNFEDHLVRQFGRTLYEIFFKSYTEKVWGIPCRELGAEWAGQRIRGLTLWSAAKQALGVGKDEVRSLVETFKYPRKGAGQLYDAMTTAVRSAGGEVRLALKATRCITDGDRVCTVIVDPGGQSLDIDHLLVSAPITELARSLDPPAPKTVLDAADALIYRSHITVNLALNRSPPFPDNWIYVHAPELRMARITSYGSFSDDMVPSRDEAALSIEYFAFENDDVWGMADDQLIAIAIEEMQRANLLGSSDVRDAFVVREADSYPTYYLGHQSHFDTIYEYLERFENLTLMGRAGMYRYNNQDHAMLTGLYAARNLLGMTNLDLFSVNTGNEYLEEVSSTRAG